MKSERRKMLYFDPDRDTLLLDGVSIYPAIAPQDLVDALDGTLEDIAGQPGWQQVKTKDRHINVCVAFDHGRAHSGYLWISVPAGMSWSDWASTEAQRRAAHEAIMGDLFQARYFHTESIRIYLACDPRDAMERIVFEFLSGMRLSIE